jgi:hypothetical protein
MFRSTEARNFFAKRRVQAYPPRAVHSTALLALLLFADAVHALAPQDFRNANELVWNAEFEEEAKTFFGSASGTYLGWSGSVFKQWYSAFGGPPEELDSLPDGWQFAACRQHACDEKAWVLLDEHGRIQLAALRHFFTRDGRWSGDPMLTIFYRDARALQHRRHALQWSRQHGSVAVVEQVELE